MEYWAVEPCFTNSNVNSSLQTYSLFKYNLLQGRSFNVLVFYVKFALSSQCKARNLTQFKNSSYTNFSVISTIIILLLPINHIQCTKSIIDVYLSTRIWLLCITINHTLLTCLHVFGFIKFLNFLINYFYNHSNRVKFISVIFIVLI